jgi:hypothetical protein
MACANSAQNDSQCFLLPELRHNLEPASIEATGTGLVVREACNSVGERGALARCQGFSARTMVMMRAPLARRRSMMRPWPRNSGAIRSSRLLNAEGDFGHVLA